MKTKHAKRKAEKRKNRRVKIDIAKNIESVKASLRRRLDNAASGILREVASNNETAAAVKKYKGQIRQILS